MEDLLTKLLLQVESMKGQLGRMASDAESEKTVRRDRNTDIDKRLQVLEIDKVQRDTTHKLINRLIAAIGVLAGSFITLLVAYFKNKT